MMKPFRHEAENSAAEGQGTDGLVDGEPKPYQLQLFVAGASLNSMKAIANVKHICETYLKGQYSLTVTDVRQQKEETELQQIIALPLLIKRLPLPERRLIGDMSDTAKVLRGLGISDESV